MYKPTIFVIALTLMAMLLSACAGQGLPTASGGVQFQSGNAGGGDPQMNVPPDGVRPTPGGESSDQSSLGNSADSGNLNSEGVPAAGIAGAAPGEPGQISASTGEGQSGPSTSGEDTSFKPPSGWLTYTDKKYGFTLSYPDTYVILPEIDPRMNAGVLYVVRFQDETIAESEGADLEPPKFMIEVYKNPQTNINQWIQNSRLAPADANFEAITLPGALSGVKVTLKTLLAPNVTYYYATKDVIYRIVPLGEYSEDMLKSFRLPEDIQH